MTEQEKIKAAQREYHRQWRAANPDKVKERSRRYWLNRAEKMEAEKQKAKPDGAVTSNCN